MPTAYDIPVEFNVSLLKDTPNPHAIVKGSKAVAEPVMSLVTSPYLALKNAIYAARVEMGLADEWFPLAVPLSPEVIQTHCGVDLQNMRLP